MMYQLFVAVLPTKISPATLAYIRVYEPNYLPHTHQNFARVHANISPVKISRVFPPKFRAFSRQNFARFPAKFSPVFPPTFRAFSRQNFSPFHSKLTYVSPPIYLEITYQQYTTVPGSFITLLNTSSTPIYTRLTAACAPN